MKISKSLAKAAFGLVVGLTVPAVVLGVGAAAHAAGDAPSANNTEAPVASVPFADALAAYNTANAALTAAVADSSATSAVKQQAYQAARLAFNQVLVAALDARSAADKAFRDAVKVANDAYKAARAVKGQTPDQRLAAQNAFTAAVSAAATNRDRAYAALVLPAPPTPPAVSSPGKPGKGKKN